MPEATPARTRTRRAPQTDAPTAGEVEADPARYVVGMRSLVRVGSRTLPDGTTEDVVVPVVVPNLARLREDGLQIHYSAQKDGAVIDLGTVDEFYAGLRKDFSVLPEFSFSNDAPGPLKKIGAIRTTVHELRVASGGENEGSAAFRMQVKFTPGAGDLHLPGLERIYLKECHLLVQVGTFAGETEEDVWAAAEVAALAAPDAVPLLTSGGDNDASAGSGAEAATPANAADEKSAAEPTGESTGA
ncbi:MAG TPA: hypothetical protein VFJ82_04360 [Longimicrobium sp.]|nr:hypothetical protein [Longimicrobium sp.]